MKAVFFGLSTAVGAVFPGDCGTSTRAKQSAFLFERLLLEGGSLVLQLDGNDVAERWLRPLAPGSGPMRAHERSSLRAASGPVVSFDALLDSLRVMDVDWAGVVIPPVDDVRPNLVRAGAHSSTPSSGWLSSALRRDLGIARRLGAALTATPVFAPLIFGEEEAPLPRAIVSPDPSNLSWEDVTRVRDHGSARAARRLMLEILALYDPEDPGAMLITFDVLAEDIEALLSDALDSVDVSTSDLVVTRLAATDAGSPVLVMERHTAEPLAG